MAEESLGAIDLDSMLGDIDPIAVVDKLVGQMKNTYLDVKNSKNHIND